MQEYPTLQYRFGQAPQMVNDAITTELPLAIRLHLPHQDEALDLSITMRTPGEELDLITGYLYTEGIIARASDILEITLPQETQAEVHIGPKVVFTPIEHRRFGYTTSSCGLCGKTDLQQLQRVYPHFPMPDRPVVTAEVLTMLPDRLRMAQTAFAQTGGIHAAALLDENGELILLREDVGRHNALDKLAGAALRQNLTPWRNKLLLLSGRISYELVQKAASLGTPIVAAIGAPSTLAIELAETTHTTLVGFLRAERFNIYTHRERVLL